VSISRMVGLMANEKRWWVASEEYGTGNIVPEQAYSSERDATMAAREYARNTPRGRRDPSLVFHVVGSDEYGEPVLDDPQTSYDRAWVIRDESRHQPASRARLKQLPLFNPRGTRRLVRRPQRLRQNPGSKVANRALGAVAGAGLQAAINNLYPWMPSDQGRLLANQLSLSDVWWRIAAPLGGALLIGIKAGPDIGVAFFGGAVGISLLAGGKVMFVDNWWPILAVPPGEWFRFGQPATPDVNTVRDLGPDGAPGFAWDWATGRVFTIVENTFAGTATSVAEAVAAAGRFF